MIPMRLKTVRPRLYELATMCKTQAQADCLIRAGIPDWSWSERPTKAQGLKSDFRVASQHSLGIASGTHDRRLLGYQMPKGTYDKMPRIAGAVFTVEAIESPMLGSKYPRGTRRLAGAQGAMWLP